jgi:hypothetical protein
MKALLAAYQASVQNPTIINVFEKQGLHFLKNLIMCNDHLFTDPTVPPPTGGPALVNVMESLTRSITHTLQASTLPTPQELDLILRDLFAKSTSMHFKVRLQRRIMKERMLTFQL